MPSVVVPQELFACAESSSFSGVYDLPTLSAGPDIYRFDSPLSWQVNVTNTGGALLVEGKIEGKAKTECARCLDMFEVSLTGDVEGFFLLSADEEVPQEWEEDEFDILPENKTIDLAPLLDAAILLEFPLIPLCKEDCKGLCGVCGENLNEHLCSCREEEDTFEEEKNPFSVLKEYPFE